MASIPVNPTEALTTIASVHSVDETVARLEALLEAKAIHVVAVVDHSGEAEKVGLQLPNTKLIIFGNPKGGTPLMKAAPTIAIDLPLKILIWKDADAHVWVSYNTPEFLAERHHLPAGLLQTLGVAGTLADQAAH